MTADRSLTHLDYYYSVERHGHEERHEWTTVKHRLDLGAVQARPATPMPCSTHARTLRLIVRAPQLRKGSRLALVGEAKTLQPQRAGRSTARRLLGQRTELGIPPPTTGSACSTMAASGGFAASRTWRSISTPTACTSTSRPANQPHLQRLPEKPHQRGRKASERIRTLARGQPNGHRANGGRQPSPTNPNRALGRDR